MTHDQIVAAIEARRQSQRMTKQAFALVTLGISGNYYSGLIYGRIKFNVRMLRRLYEIGIDPEVLLGNKTTTNK